MSTPTTPPKRITGGCLCGRVRYQIDFKPDHDFKEQSRICQCTQCRKNSGDLIRNFHRAAQDEVTWLSKSTYTLYQHTPQINRGFCNKCGSWLTWSDEKTDQVGFGTGSIDEDFLREFGRLLTADGEGQRFFEENAIVGITDAKLGMVKEGN